MLTPVSITSPYNLVNSSLSFSETGLLSYYNFRTPSIILFLRWTLFFINYFLLLHQRVCRTDSSNNCHSETTVYITGGRYLATYTSKTNSPLPRHFLRLSRTPRLWTHESFPYFQSLTVISVYTLGPTIYLLLTP